MFLPQRKQTVFTFSPLPDALLFINTESLACKNITSNLSVSYCFQLKCSAITSLFCLCVKWKLRLQWQSHLPYFYITVLTEKLLVFTVWKINIFFQRGRSFFEKFFNKDTWVSMLRVSFTFLILWFKLWSSVENFAKFTRKQLCWRLFLNTFY